MKSLAVTKQRIKPRLLRIFESRLAVFRVKANFIAPYRKCKYVYLDKAKLKTKRAFIKHLQTLTHSWPNGPYYLKLSDGRVFARFDVVNGKVHKFYKESPVTGKIYPVWAWWK